MTLWYLLDGLLCARLVDVGDEAVAAAEARQRVHHQPQVPDGAALLKQRDQLVLKHVLRDLPTEHLRQRGTGGHVRTRHTTRKTHNSALSAP